ncbi:MAG: acyltransferase family protein, partial [Lachnospiraceae bacterium]|nr:acyltransferase family protein [Lachnospiraceae bacterium]
MEKSKSSKKVYMEILRIAACFFVIVNHTVRGYTVNFTEGIDFYLCSVIYVMCKIAVPVFLMISGAVLIPKEDTPKKSIMRVVNAVVIFIGASAIYYIKYISEMNAGFSVKDFAYIIWTGEVTNAFWYMYTYIAILMMLPIIRIIAKGIVKNNLYKIYFVIWIIFFSIIPAIIRQFEITEMTEHFDLSLLSGYVVYFIAGYIIDSVIERKNNKKMYGYVGLVIYICIAFAFAALLYYMAKNDISYRFFKDVRYLPTVVPSILVFFTAYYLEPVNETVRKVFTYLGGLTFGTYLLSDLMIEKLWPVYEWAINRKGAFCSMVV